MESIIDGPRVTKVGVRTGDLVDQVIFWFDDNTQTVWGKTGGDIPEIWHLDPGDYITRIDVRQGAKLDQIQFYTAYGEVSPKYGGWGGDPDSFEAEEDCEIVGLLVHGYDKRASSKISGIIQKRRDNPVLPPQFLVIPGQGWVQLDPGCSPSSEYTYKEQSSENCEVTVYLTYEDLERLLENPDLEEKDKGRLIEFLEMPGITSGVIFFGKIGLGEILNKWLTGGFTHLVEGAVSIGFMKNLTTFGISEGLRHVAKDSLLANSQIRGGILGVLLAHILAPIYAANGEGGKAVEIAGGAMIGLGAAVVVGGPIGLIAGALAGLTISAIFSICGGTATEYEAKLNSKQAEMYEDITTPLNGLILKYEDYPRRCSNGHYFADLGPTTLRYLHDKKVLREPECSAGFSGCAGNDKKWEFRCARFYCHYCAETVCESCMLKHYEGKNFPKRVLWD